MYTSCNRRGQVRTLAWNHFPGGWYVCSVSLDFLSLRFPGFGEVGIYTDWCSSLWSTLPKWTWCFLWSAHSNIEGVLCLLLESAICNWHSWCSEAEVMQNSNLLFLSLVTMRTLIYVHQKNCECWRGTCKWNLKIPRMSNGLNQNCIHLWIHCYYKNIISKLNGIEKKIAGSLQLHVVQGVRNLIGCQQLSSSKSRKIMSFNLDNGFNFTVASNTSPGLFKSQKIVHHSETLSKHQ